MPTISLTLPVSGNVITAGLHATNYTAIQGLVNGGLDTANWASGKIFAPSKIMQESAADGDGMAWDNSATLWKRTTDKRLRLPALAGVPSGALDVPVVYDRVTTAVDVQNTVTETSLYTKSISANDMGTNRSLELLLVGDHLYNNNVADTITLRIKFGGTTFYADAANLTAIGAGRHAWTCHVRVANLAAANAQWISAELGTQIGSEAAPTAGLGKTKVTDGSRAMTALSSNGNGAIDTTANQTLDVTAQWSAASANNSWRMKYARLLLV